MKDLENHVEESAQEQLRPRSSTALANRTTDEMRSALAVWRSVASKAETSIMDRVGELIDEIERLRALNDGLVTELEKARTLLKQCDEIFKQVQNAFSPAAIANEERGVSDSTPQSAQRGSPNQSGAA